jgi:ketosteroid isomerase-like protein
MLGYYIPTMKSTRRNGASEWVRVFNFRGGKVPKFREFTDTATFAQAYRG